MKKLFLIFFFSNLVLNNNYTKNIDTNLSTELSKIIRICKISSYVIFKNINQSLNKNGMTLLMYAANENCFNLAKFLLKMDADHLIKNIHNLNSYDIAKKQNNSQLMNLLLPTDLTIVGFAKYNDGIGRIPIGIIDCLSNDIFINFINTKSDSLKIEQNKEKTICEKTFSLMNSDINKFSRVVLFTDLLTTKNQIKKLNKYKDRIKLVYSMFESTRIPKDWVNCLNDNFDAVLVPDDFFINVYKNSGIKIPIFVLPLGIYLDEFLKRPIKKTKNQKFVFGCLSSFDPRKNHKLLINAFAQEFKDNSNVILKLNGRSYQSSELQKLIDSLKAKNIILTKEILTWDSYIKNMESFDCYVNIPKGEGFSITPREALALGIPCIVTNNTAQKTICKSHCVKIIDSNILEKAHYVGRWGDLGYFFNCSIKDVRKALRDIYENYDRYLKKAHSGREWVKQYRWQNLKLKYLNIAKPKKLILNNKNEITEEYLMTDSPALYNKYLKIINNTF